MTIKMPEFETTAGPVQTLIADVRLARKRLKETPLETLEAINTELRDNTYPMIIATLEQIMEVEDVVQEVVDQTGSYIQPELAATIFHVVSIGAALCEEIKKLELDDVTTKKLGGIIQGFEHAAELCVMGVSEATVDPDDEETEEPDEDEETEGDEELPEVDKTPAETPKAKEEEVETNSTETEDNNDA